MLLKQQKGQGAEMAKSQKPHAQPNPPTRAGRIPGSLAGSHLSAARRYSVRSLMSTCRPSQHKAVALR